jgi:hypothetical protein
MGDWRDGYEGWSLGTRATLWRADGLPSHPSTRGAELALGPAPSKAAPDVERSIAGCGDGCRSRGFAGSRAQSRARRGRLASGLISPGRLGAIKKAPPRSSPGSTSPRSGAGRRARASSWPRRAGRGLNGRSRPGPMSFQLLLQSRAENSRQPTRRRELKMGPARVRLRNRSVVTQSETTAESYLM